MHEAIDRLSLEHAGPERMQRSPSGKPSNGTPVPLSRNVIRLRELLESNPASDLKMADRARALRANPYVLARRFKRELGVTPHAYLLDIRVRRAAELLCSGVPPVEVALLTGFYDQGHLGRIFKSRLGLTPGQYVRRSRGR